MSRITRKILSLVIIISIFVSVTTVSSFAFTEGNGFTTSKCTENETVASVIAYLKFKHPNKSGYTHGGTCFGFATEVNDLIAAENKETEYKALRFTKKNFLAKCKGVRPGTHIRFSDSKEFNGGYGHSVVLFKVTDNTVYFADNNYYAYDTVCYNHCSVDEFCSYYDYKYINRITVPTKYKKYSKTKVAAKVYKTGNVRLRWIKTTYTEKYYVYRSYSKKGIYKKIAETTDTSYLDKKVKRNTKAYYKVESIRTKSNTTSEIISIKSK